MRLFWDVRVSPRGWGSATVLAAVLLGLAAMHGLAPHGGFGHDVAPETVAHGVDGQPGPVSSGHGGDASRPPAAGPAISARSVPPGPEEASADHPGPQAAGALRACVAVLLIVGVALLARRRPTTRPVLVLPRWLNRRTVPYVHRPPAPPSLAELAVLRC